MSDVAAPGRMEGATPFWRFSLAFYSRAGVPDVLIKLQDEFGIDVNLVLLALWLGSERRLLTDPRMREIGERSNGWQTKVVSPLREIRRTLKESQPLVAGPAAEAFRSKVKALELEAEHLQQDALHALGGNLEASENVTSEEAARRNLATYARFAGVAFPRNAVDALLVNFRAQATKS